MLSVSLSVACVDLIICLQGSEQDLQPCSGNPCSLCTQLSLSPPPVPIWMPSSRLIKKGPPCRLHIFKKAQQCRVAQKRPARGLKKVIQRTETSLLQCCPRGVPALKTWKQSLKGFCLHWVGTVQACNQGKASSTRAIFAVRLAACGSSSPVGKPTHNQHERLLAASNSQASFMPQVSWPTTQ